MDNKNFNAYAALLFVDLIIESSNFYETLINEFPDIETLATNLKKIPSDENRNLVFSVYERNEETFKEFTHTYIQNNSTEYDWNSFLSSYEVTVVAGKFFKIDKTELAYEELINKMHTERWVFHHMSVTSEHDKYVVFFA